MFEPSRHVTLIPGDPWRATRLALWGGSDASDPEGSERVLLALPGERGVESVPRDCRVLALPDVLDDLVGIPVDSPGASTSVRALAVIVRSALALIGRGRLQPRISAEGNDTWTVGPLDESDQIHIVALAEWVPPTLHCHTTTGVDPHVISASDAVVAVYNTVADALPRTGAAATVSRQGAWAGRDVVAVGELQTFLDGAETADRTIVRLRLQLPVSPESPFEADLQVRSAKDPDRVADAADLWAGTAAGFDERTEADMLVILRRATPLWAPFAALLEQSEPTRVEISDDHAMDLLGDLANDLRGVGIEVMAPRELMPKVASSAHINAPPQTRDTTSGFDLLSVCELTWSATIDGEPLTEEELSRLAQSGRRFLELRGSWVLVDDNVIRRLGRVEEISGTDALAAALSGDFVSGHDLVPVSVASPLASLADRMRNASSRHELAEPPGLTAELRPYQRSGIAWLNEMLNLGFGGVLADDMGLGKTVQLIAVHLHRQPSAVAPTLVICPAGLVGNWQREFQKFAPDVVVHRYHGSDRALGAIAADEVVITTYGIMRRDIEELSRREWGLVVADEAQQVKNPNSATARALRKVPSAARVAMTGTPVENRLSELWALLDWTTPGLLGRMEDFARTIAVPIERERDPVATERFAHLIAPFVLRRRKDDPDVIPDLPPKTETDHPVSLTLEQASLYRAAVEEILAAIQTAEGIQRRGLVLKLITALKQICNHPAQYLRELSPLSGRSGKMLVFEELVQAITEAEDSTLVFTQYVKMGDLLMTRLAELGIASEFLHGSLGLDRRADMVDRFQEGDFPVLVVSLKAGGTGLNLTRATHVIHYDRWWNPAVENQASDRVWRIGQDRPVQIHRLISEGTIEDRIATLLDQKSALAESVVGGSGEAWLTEMSDAELGDLVRLGSGGLSFDSEPPSGYGPAAGKVGT